MKSTYSKNNKVRRLVVIGALGGISIFLGISGFGIIRTPLFALTIMHIPTIIGAIIEGPFVGIAVGSIFGLFSMYQAATIPTLTSFIFLNPIIALIPRVLIGIVSYYSFKFLKNKFKNKSISIGISASLATLINTIGVLGLTYILYLDKYAAAREISTDAVAATLLAIGFTNGIPETIGAVVICIPIISALFKIKKRK